MAARRSEGSRPSPSPDGARKGDARRLALIGVAVFGAGMFVIFACGMIAGVPEITDSVYVVQAFSGSPAEAAGLRAGDRILELDGRPAEYFTFADRIREAGNRPVLLKLAESSPPSPDGARKGDRTVTVTPSDHRIGIQLGPAALYKTGIVRAGKVALGWPLERLRALARVFRVRERVELAGPIGTVPVARPTQYRAAAWSITGWVADGCFVAGLLLLVVAAFRYPRQKRAAPASSA